MEKVPVFHSKINVNSEEYVQNYKGMLNLVEDLQSKLKSSLDQGPQKTIERHISRGQLLARDRIELLLDQDSPFLELMPLAGYEQENSTLGGSVVVGIGLVSGIECMVSATIPTLKGGASNEVTVLKGNRATEIAFENQLPSISLIQSAGADLRQQSKVFHIGGGTFRSLAHKSKLGLPTISVVFGSCTAGGAYAPGMSDYVIMVKGQAKVFLGGPPLVKMATGEEVDDETLGGAEMHARVSGLCDFLASNEYSAIQKARETVTNFKWSKKTPLPASHLSGSFEEPFYPIDQLLGIVPPSVRIPFDVREVIIRLVDGSRFSEFKPLYGSTIITGFASIHGIPLGIIGNNGVIFSESANKATQFIELCNQIHTPILFLQNITGFMVGSKYESGGIIKHGSKFINAVSNSGVPHITVILGASYGAGNYAMCGRAYKPRFLWSWPNSKCSVMGPEQLTGVMDMVMRQAAEKEGRKVDEEMAEVRKKMLGDLVEKEMDVYFTSSRMIDDGVIDPRDTRNVLGFCLSVIHGSPIQGANHSGVSRM